MSQSYESFGKYILLEKLATGGMAEVYLARNVGANGISKLVAIKRILPQYSENPEFIDMFKNEAQIAVNLAHSNIVMIHDFGLQNQQFFLVMDYVEGRNLRQILNKMKKSGLTFSIEQVLYIVKEVAAGLDHAHRCLDATTGKPLNITHRDMSPQNVMISFEGEVKVVDFGIAKAEIELESTRVGTLKGKFGYMSPEQAEGQIVDLRTDIFSLGIVLWELLANDRLFVANNEVNTLRKIRDCQVPSLRKINPNIPQELERICNKALARDRNLRYQTAAALHRELNRFLNRQYPDFSPHDFSVFIKTLFAGDILENRKKIIEYSKIEIARPAAQQTPPNVQPLQNTTPPLPPQSTQQQVQQPQPAVPRGTTAPQENTGTRTEQTENSIAADFSTPNQRESTQSKAKTTAPQTAQKEPVPAKTEEKKDANPVPRPQQRREPINDRGGKEPHSGDLAGDYKDLRIDTSNKPSRLGEPFGINEGSFTSSNIHTYTRSRANYAVSEVSVQGRRHRVLQIVQNSVLFLAGLILTSLGGFYLLDRDGMMRNAEKLVRTFHVNEDSEMFPVQNENSSVAKYKIPISSDPPGAEVRVNGSLIKDVTPTAYDFNAGEEYQITIRKENYIPYQQKLKFNADTRLFVPLARSRIAFIDVIVYGSGEIFVDNRRIATAGPLINYQIPANQDVNIKAFDGKTGALAEQTIRLGEGHSRRIELRPRITVSIPPIGGGANSGDNSQRRR